MSPNSTEAKNSDQTSGDLDAIDQRRHGWRRVGARGVVALVILVAFAAGGVAFASRQFSSKVAAGPTVTVDRGAVTLSVTGSGLVGVGSSTLGPSTTATATAGTPIYPLTSGRVVATFVAPGQSVRAGQALVQLADSSVSAQVLQAQLGLATAMVADQLAHKSPSSAIHSSVSAAQLAVRVAQLKLRDVLATPTASPPGQVAIARLSLTLAQQQLTTLMSPTTLTRKTAQLAVAKAKADLVAIYATAQRAKPSDTQIAAAQLNLTLAEQLLSALTIPTTLAQTNAQLAIAKAQENLDSLFASAQNAKPLVTQVAAAQPSLSLALMNLAALVHPTPVELASAQLAVAKARADLDAIYVTSIAATPLPSQIIAAQDSLTLAQQQLLALTTPAPSDVTSAQLAVAKARDALNALYTTASAAAPLPSQIAAARATLTLAQQQLLALTTPAPSDVTSAQLAVAKARDALNALVLAPVAVQRSAAIAQARLDLANATANAATLESTSVPSSALSLRVSDLQLAAAQAALVAAQNHQASLTVRASASGTVTGLFVTSGVPADPATAVATVADLSHLSVTIQMSEFDVVGVRIGDRALVNVAALGGTAIVGRVSTIAPVGVSNSGVVQFPVTVTIDKVPPALRPGMLASVDVVTALRHAVIRVPLDAVSTLSSGNNSGQTVVTQITRSGRARVRFVTLGLVGANYAEVLKGVAPGVRLQLPLLVPAGASGSNGNAPPGLGVNPSNQGNGN